MLVQAACPDKTLLTSSTEHNRIQRAIKFYIDTTTSVQYLVVYLHSLRALASNSTVTCSTHVHQYRTILCAALPSPTSRVVRFQLAERLYLAQRYLVLAWPQPVCMYVYTSQGASSLLLLSAKTCLLRGGLLPCCYDHRLPSPLPLTDVNFV